MSRDIEIGVYKGYSDKLTTVTVTVPPDGTFSDLLAQLENDIQKQGIKQKGTLTCCFLPTGEEWDIAGDKLKETVYTPTWGGVSYAYEVSQNLTSDNESHKHSNPFVLQASPANHSE
eukprot:TRINITY_DN53323_c0_g1_i2.p1 TRINITY_DN53323_c0_g1~~TRINITY_DN53323_c0_g1_i2.p1  ORF type:complete len:117 (+),score=5.20 TRINITY_DN53323_c0_g1_i2:73-423(+)